MTPFPAWAVINRKTGHAFAIYPTRKLARIVANSAAKARRMARVIVK